MQNFLWYISWQWHTEVGFFEAIASTFIGWVGTGQLLGTDSF